MTTITTLNCNGLRSAARKGLWRWVKEQSPDVLCLQEIRIQHHQLHEAEGFPKGYFAYYNPAERPGYAGTAILSKQKPEQVMFGGGWPRADSEGRWTEAHFASTVVVSLYVPSGSGLGAKQIAKEDFMEALQVRMKSLKTIGKRIIICADWNTCHQNADIKNWKSNQKNSGFLPNERAWLDNLITVEGWRDCFRDIAQEPDTYSWWSNRGRAYENNVGWRLDYQLVSSTEDSGLAKTYIDRAAQLSDHAPVTHWYEWELYP